MRTIKKLIMIVLFYLMRVFPIRKDKIVISSYLGQGYGDNAKYIVEQLLKQDTPYDIVWLVRNMSTEFPQGVRKVSYLSVRSVYEQATARVWIDNRRKPGYVRKRKGQFYLMTWHGGIGLKKVEEDAADSLPPSYIAAAKRDSRMADLFLSNSKWVTDEYRKAFWYEGRIVEIGFPREDIFYRERLETVRRIKSQLGISEDAKIVLYAPTFRQNIGEEPLLTYQINWERVIENCRKRFGGEWKGLIRLHPNLLLVQDKLSLPEMVKNVTAYPDMQELLLASDILISDYSSCIFDFAITKRPVFLYTPDLSEYLKNRDLYFDLRHLPFPLAESEEALADVLIQFNAEKYRDDLREFMDACGVVSGGNAAEATAEMIRGVVEGKA